MRQVENHWHRSALETLLEWIEADSHVSRDATVRRRTATRVRRRPIAPLQPPPNVDRTQS